MNASQVFSGLGDRRRWARTLGVLVLASVVAMGSAQGQLNPGDLLVAGGTGVYAVGGGGGPLRTVVLAQSTLLFTGVAMAPNNRDFVATATDGWFTTDLLYVTPAGTVSTVARLAEAADKVVADEDGSYVLPLTRAPLRLAHITPGGVVTTIAARPSSGWTALSLAVDVNTGDYLVGTGGWGPFYRMLRNGQSTAITSLHLMYHADIVSDARTGFALAGAQNGPVNSVYRLNPVSGQTVPLINLSVSAVSGLAYDRQRDDWPVATFGGDQHLFRMSRLGWLTTVVPGLTAMDVEVYGCRNVVATSRPQVGTAFPLTFSEPGSPQRIYVAAASLGTLPGIPTSAGIVDLQMDPLFWLSLSAPVLFRGFAGQLDAQGSAQGSIQIPNQAALRGLRFYVSFVTFAGARITAIANTAGFTVL